MNKTTWAFDFSNYLIDINYVCNCCMSELCAGSHTVKLMSGREIHVTQFSWPTMLLYNVFSLGDKGLFRSFILSFDKVISWMESMYELWSILRLKSEVCFNPIPIYVNASISSGLKLKISFKLVMIVPLKYWFPPHIISSTWHAKIRISVLFSLQ